MTDVLWMILFFALLGLAAGSVLSFIIRDKGGSEAKVKMWCTSCHKNNLVVEELVRQWVNEARRWDEVTPLECERCRQRSMVPDRPWMDM